MKIWKEFLHYLSNKTQKRKKHEIGFIDVLGSSALKLNLGVGLLGSHEDIESLADLE